MDLSTPVQYLKGIGPLMARKLEKLEIFTVGDLLTHAPTRYEDWSKIVKIKDILPNEPITVIGQIAQVKNVYTRNRKNFQTATLTDETGIAELLWFNQGYITDILKPGTQIAIAGKATHDGVKIKFAAPDYEVIYENRPLRHMGKLIPIYPQTNGVSSKWLRNKIALFLENELTDDDYLPKHIIDDLKLRTLRDAYQRLHTPETYEAVADGRKRLAFDELFLLQLASMLRKNEWQQKQFITAFTIRDTSIDAFIQGLPFTLTPSQTKAYQEILRELGKNTPMNRLLQGDVGSGKTVIAAIAALATHHNQKTTAIMAPTEILAQQHFATLSQLFRTLNVTVRLITSSGQKIAGENAAGAIIVGTHALLEEKYDLGDLGLVVIDEQHRFGVSQRAKLRLKGKTTHTLTMTATPIPRTIMLTLHGDLELSVLNELPSGRIPIKTRVVPFDKRATAYKWISDKITSTSPHQQAFIVCPFIETSESLSTVKAAKVEFDHLAKNVFPHLKLGLLHGKMKSKDKEAVLSGFRAGTYDILVSTPVVEVGIDIPNATIMMIEAAERFGLAQLHQLRGRVGRGDKQSYCLLFTSSKETQEANRLKAMEVTTSGIELAEFDLKIRGPGSVYGTAQHGKALFKLATYDDFALIAQAQNAASGILAQDPEFTQNPALKQRLKSSTIPEVTPD